MASSAPPTATASLDGISSLFPPSLQPYVLSTLYRIDTSLAALSTRTGLPPATSLVASLLALLLSLAAMWSYWKRPSLSPWASMNQGRAPDVTEEDYSYITSQDLEEPAAAGLPEDDVLLIKYRGRTEKARFPAYSIGDGKLMVHDIRDRVGVMFDLSDSQTRRVRLFYKGRQLKEPAALARDYGVKNMSEILAMVREGTEEPRAGAAEDGDVVVAEDGSSHGGSSAGAEKSSRRRKGRRSKKKVSPASSPRPGSATSGGSPWSPPASPQREAQLNRLDELAAYYQTELEPLCFKFTSDPPQDKRKREDEHRRLSETVLRHVILKLDEVEPNGDEVVRSRRKGLVKEMQAVLAGLDAAFNGG